MTSLEQAINLHQRGRLAEAEQHYRTVLAQRPQDFDTLHLLGLLMLQQGQLADAAEFLSAAVKRRPNAVDALSNLGAILARLGRYGEALTAFDRLLTINAKDIDAHFSRAVVLGQLGRFEEAVAAYDKVLATRPDDAVTWSNRGNALFKLERKADALESFDKALALKPDLADAWSGRGNVSYARKHYNEALAAYDQALALNPAFAEAWNGRAMVFSALKRYEEAIEGFDRALAFKRDYAEAWLGKGCLLTDTKQYDDALDAFDKSLEIKPDLAESWTCRGNLFVDSGRPGEALASYDKAWAIKPEQKLLAGLRVHVRMDLCDWKGLERDCTQLIAAVREERAMASPFIMLGIPSSADVNLKCAQVYATECDPGTQVRAAQRYPHDRIRVAYVSADLREHAASYLLAELFERHDRSRFETYAISLSGEQSTPMRERLKTAFDQFIDVEQKSDWDVATLLREMEIDIAVDLAGYTRGARSSIFAMRPAPIQLSFLGYPGTSGSNYIDYFIGDKIVLPFEQQPYFTENIVYLPGCFMPTDSKRPTANVIPVRADVGLPEDAFVFCSFCGSYKINSLMFDVWMRLLRNVEGSVLWLLHSNDTAAANLRREAEARGVAGHRLVFAPMAGRAEHLARSHLAELFLNTHPVNAGANAIDALSLGTPIVAYLGKTFVERVTASVLQAIGMPELVVSSLEEYEALALKLAREPAMLAQIKAKLARNRETYPLFDIERFTRHLEAAYTTMWEIWQRGEAPKSFAVEPIASSGKGEIL